MNLENIYKILLSGEIISAVLVFPILFFITAPYGRHSRKGWGKEINAKLSWVLMESPSVFIVAYLFFSGKIVISTIFLFVIWQIHYLHRTFIFPFLLKPGKKMPLLIPVFSLIFNFMNAFINGFYVFYLATYPDNWIFSFKFIFGTIIFFSGLVINIHSDFILRNLRKKGEKGYKIPNEGLHKFVVNPNYFGEILEWLGWAIATWSLPGFAFFIFTVANLVPRADANLKWYKEKFKDFPKNRKRVIPFIY